MAQPLYITQSGGSGEVQVSSTGPVAGTLSTNGLVKAGKLHIRARGLLPGQSVRVAIEDTNVPTVGGGTPTTAFQDATVVWSVDIAQGSQTANVPENEVGYSVSLSILPDIRFGSVNQQLRANVQVLSSGATPLIQAWLEQ